MIIGLATCWVFSPRRPPKSSPSLCEQSELHNAGAANIVIIPLPKIPFPPDPTSPPIPRRRAPASPSAARPTSCAPPRPSDLPPSSSSSPVPAASWCGQHPTQWVNGYPSDDILLADIAAGTSYIVERGGQVVATFVLRPGDDPRMPSSTTVPGPPPPPTSPSIAWRSNGGHTASCNSSCTMPCTAHHTLRIDTHRDNHLMRHLILKAGFRYCGIIHTATGSGRLALSV